ncbi:helix-turn-helix domain-containing protein [Staphylococcus saprophyticus]|uniref:helix-turn-helix domain-containing protein n=1 Tax=Staphylococcus saprophyticus TaxID=29385 RepID=UPI0008530D27|nr:helix-turn-helix transcriptional regulator [Staphylococcus saprophyticus]OEK44578.1 DNA-binding protein [Staphylococcus saprophyticus]
MIITSNLRVKMAEFSYSIKDVHRKTNLSRTTISNLYNGYSDGIKFDTLEKLCELFSCTPNDLIKVNHLIFNDLIYEKRNTVYDLKDDNTFDQNDRMMFYKALLSIKLNDVFYKIEIPFIGEYTYQNSEVEIGTLRLEEYDNEFIADKLNIKGVLRTPLSNKIEKYVLENFQESKVAKKDFDSIDEIQLTYK